MKKRVLFICTHNSARSQMAEGLVNALWGDRFEAFSAGTEPGQVRRGAILVMAEIGIDIGRHHSKKVDEFVQQKFDYIMTVCDNAARDCPFFPGGRKYIHRGFEDPAACAGTEAEVLACFRKSRDEIKAWIEETIVQAPAD
jgi:arsenate reductase